ncbi:MAG: hypothetical protein JWN40_2249 [Phycisphaerales bacterium]|nr:hypothetical protein [Phycisphaerales bacterium]
MGDRTICWLAAVATGLGLCASSARGAAVLVTAQGVSTSTNLNWITNGLATLDGATSGLNWLVSGQQENSDWTRIDGAVQGGIGGVMVEWPVAGSFAQLTYSGSPGILGIGPEMPEDLGTLPLRIAEVAPGPATYTLNGVSQVATAVGQVLVWRAVSVTPGDTLTFTSNGTFSAGPIAFSAPEPASLGALALCGLTLLIRRRARRA